jgi:guanosine-3',5'-bis(diphosphate) 3'-pyrophosphohydrolase
MTFHEQDITLLLTSLQFATEKHRNQRRKNFDASPYINHPIQVAELLWRVGQVRDITILVGALLHDTLEDTSATAQEIGELFGETVLFLVQEVSDDKRLPKAQRKQLQIERAPYVSNRAKHIKLADKISNIQDLIHEPPHEWSHQRRQLYLAWSMQVVAGLRGVNLQLEAYYDKIYAQASEMLALSENE